MKLPRAEEVGPAPVSGYRPDSGGLFVKYTFSHTSRDVHNLNILM